MQRSARIQKELSMQDKNPSPGISCWLKSEGKIDDLEASIIGPPNSPFAGGVFKLSISVPERYPFVPPLVTFTTKVYHPNIDNAGRICLDVLKIPPQGSWKPNLNIDLVLKSIRLLLSEPNPDDPLMSEIANECSSNPELFKLKAKQWTQQYAV